MNLSAIGFIAYLLALVVIGVVSARASSEGVGSYFLAGRSLNRWVVALSAVASGRSAWLLLGFVGVAYTNGITAMWAAVGYITVECLMFFFYAPKLRQFTEENDCITIPDFFAAKLGDPHGHLRGLLVLIIAVFMVAYVSAQFVAGGKAFFSSFGIDQTTGVFLTAAIILSYTLLGGFVAVSKTDVVQAFCMLLALVILPIVAIVNFGGWNAVAEAAVAWSPGASFFDPWAAGAGAIIGWLGIGLGSPGNPHIVVRFMSIRKREDLFAAAVVATLWNIILAAGALLIGITAKAYFPFADSLPGGDAEQAFPYLASELLHPLLFGLIIAAIFSAIMSSADSQLLVAASGIVRDFYQKLWLKDKVITEKRLVVLSRMVVAALVAGALIFGFYAEDVVFWLVLFAWAGLGATIGPTSLLAMFWKGTTRAGAMAGMITGGLLVLAWKLVPYYRENIWDMYELVPAFIGSSIATVVVSLATKKSEES